MDMIYANERGEDIGILSSFNMDMAFGYDENDFEIKTSIDNHVCDRGYRIYSEGREYGGIIDGVKVNTSDKTLVYTGRTWHGILNSKIISPNPGQDYYTVSGDANSIIAILIERVGLGNMFRAEAKSSGISISNYGFDRYIECYTGLMKMLASKNGKLLFRYERGKVTLSAVPLTDYSKNEEFDSDLVAFQIKKNYNALNHVIALGKGELKDRTVLHVFSDSEGNITESQHLFGLDEVCVAYDYSNAEDEEELKKGAIEKIQEAHADSIELSLNSTDEYDVGDIVGARENITGIFVKTTINKKIIKIEDGKPVELSYSVENR